MGKRLAIWWIRHDLRLHDNASLHAAVDTADAVLPLFVWDAESAPVCEDGQRSVDKLVLGGANQWWLAESLKHLQSKIESAGTRLHILKSSLLDALDTVGEQYDVSLVAAERRFEPGSEDIENAVQAWCQRRGIECVLTKPNHLVEPGQITSQSGAPMRVFTPFWKRLQGVYQPGTPIPEPDEISGLAKWHDVGQVDPDTIAPTHPWAKKLAEHWEPGEASAHAALDLFFDKTPEYKGDRDFPCIEGTSKLSPHIHFGEVSVQAIWTTLCTHEKAEPFLRQLAWREFAYHLLSCFPETIDTPMMSSFEAFPWQPNEEEQVAWTRGRTGYPIIDAGMRELWETGWMHNRVRMIVASFLTKHLLMPWKTGAEWFEDTLVDADLANNTMGWQWVAGCGADAAPYFRVFNPILQGKKFDPEGEYVRRWLPELKDLPDKFIHEPWAAPESTLQTARVNLGSNYPHPMIDHAKGRQRALEAYATIKG
ncbi:MAG: cryptochrome/photolyase family protein [Phycisphaerae bacterium]